VFCVVAERKNEFQKEFTEIFFEHLILFYQSDSSRIKPIAKNVAKKVIDFRLFYALILDFLRKKFDEKEDSLKLIDTICNEFDFEIDLEKVSRDIELKLDEKQLNNEYIDYVLSLFIEESDVAYRSAYMQMFNKYLSKLLSNKNFEDFDSTYDRIFENLNNIKDYKHIVELACRASQLLNLINFPELALRRVNSCKEYLNHNKVNVKEYDHYDLRTEEANSLRYLGRYKESLKLYIENQKNFLDDEISYSSYNYRINERNLAIVHNDLNQPSLSLKILMKLIPHSSDKEKVVLFNSIGNSYSISSRYSKAYDFYLKGYELLEDTHESMQNEKIWLLLGLKNSARKLGLSDIAAQAAFEALNIAQKEDNQILSARIGASIIINRKSLKIENDEYLVKLRSYTIQLIEKLLPLNNIIKLRQDDCIGLNQSIIILLFEQNELEKCETVIYRLLDEFKFNFKNKWQVYWILSLLQIEKNLVDEAFQSTFHAYSVFYQEINSEDRPFDNVLIANEIDRLQLSSINIFLKKYSHNLISDIQFFNIIDIQNSLILLSNLHKKELISEISYIQEQDILYLYTTGNIKKLAILQSFNLSSSSHFLLTIIGDKSIEYKTLDWSMSINELVKLGKRIDSKINNWNPAKKENPFSTINELSHFTINLMNEIQTYCDAGTHICIVANGFMADIPLHYVISKKYSCNYAPSISILRELRGKRNININKISNFYVWRHNEYAKIVSSLKKSAEYLESNIHNYNMAYEKIEGLDGTKNNLIDALKNSGIVKISCHGYVDKYRNIFSLMLSNGNQLPPTNYEAIFGENSKEFLLNWNELNFDNCASFVFSSACSSGTIYTTEGNESLGLGRALMNNGCKSFISPSWEVVSDNIQEIIDDTILDYMSDNSSLADILYKNQKKAENNNCPEWIAYSLNIFGDWL